MFAGKKVFLSNENQYNSEYSYYYYILLFQGFELEIKEILRFAKYFLDVEC